MQVIAMMLLIRINYMKRLTAKYMLVTPYMMMKMFASVNFLKQKYSPAVNTKKNSNQYYIKLALTQLYFVVLPVLHTGTAHRTS